QLSNPLTGENYFGDNSPLLTMNQNRLDIELGLMGKVDYVSLKYAYEHYAKINILTDCFEKQMTPACEQYTSQQQAYAYSVAERVMEILKTKPFESLVTMRSDEEYKYLIFLFEQLGD